MGILDNVTSGKIKRKRKTFLYGTHGIGKTTFASKFPNPIFIQTEDGSSDLDVTRTPVLTKAGDVVSACREAIDSDYGTIVLDSIDWLEALVEKDLLNENFNQAFGQGLVEVGRRIGAVLGLLNKAVDSGKHVVILGHAHIKTVTRPDGSSWSRYEPKLGKHAYAKVSEWCDELLFANTVIKTQNKQVGMKQIAVGRETEERALYTTGSATYDAKHRASGLQDQYNLADFDTYFSDLA